MSRWWPRWSRCLSLVLVVALLVQLIPSTAAASVVSPAGRLLSQGRALAATLLQGEVSPDDVPVAAEEPLPPPVTVRVRPDTGGSLGTDKMFTSQRLDSGADLYFYNARYYDAAVGRFISPDSIVPDLANPQVLNRYSYVLNNPLKYVDQDGQFAFLAVLVAVVIQAINAASVTYDAYQLGKNPSLGNLGWLALDVVDPSAVPWGAARNLGKALAKGGKLVELNPRSLGLRNFTKENFREALSRLTGKSFTAAEREAHHVLPLKFEREFKAAGIDNINDPRFGSWVDPSLHQGWSQEYNDDWAKFFKEFDAKGRPPTPDEVFRQAQELAEKYHFDVQFTVL